MNNKSDLLKLPTKNKKEIIKLLKKRELEDMQAIHRIESFLKQKRGYIFRTPPKGSPVILLLSGGLDTVIMWDILMCKYQLEVYPLFLKRGQIRMSLEEKSIDYFSHYYAKKYPKLFHKPEKVTTFIPPLEIRWKITKEGEKPINNETRGWLGIPTYSSLLVNYAVQYAYYKEISDKIKLRSIFCGFMEKDGLSMKYETLTAIRAITYNICILTNDFSWQFISLALEKELGLFFHKEVLINWAKIHSIPIEKTYSCIRLSYFHCGDCYYCKYRQKSFRLANIEDKTFYLNNTNFGLFYKVLNKALLSFNVAKFLVSILVTLVKNYIYYFKFRY